MRARESPVLRFFYRAGYSLMNCAEVDFDLICRAFSFEFGFIFSFFRVDSGDVKLRGNVLFSSLTYFDSLRQGLTIGGESSLYFLSYSEQLKM